jgi:DNA-directed RNA polymerase specialized sigma24 family protein
MADADSIDSEARRRLPPDEREVLTLRDLDGFSGEETAMVLHLSVPATNSRLHRARIHLAAVVRAQSPSQQRSAAHA